MYAGVRNRDGLKVAIKHVAKVKIKEWGYVSQCSFNISRGVLRKEVKFGIFCLNFVKTESDLLFRLSLLSPFSSSSFARLNEAHFGNWTLTHGLAPQLVCLFSQHFCKCLKYVELFDILKAVLSRHSGSKCLFLWELLWENNPNNSPRFGSDFLFFVFFAE